MPACLPAYQAQAFQTLPETPREPEHSLGQGLPMKCTSVFLSATSRAPVLGSDLGDLCTWHLPVTSFHDLPTPATGYLDEQACVCPSEQRRVCVCVVLRVCMSMLDC